MKAKLGRATVEGFISYRVIEFENGLLLRGPSLLWIGAEKKAEEEAKFLAVIEELRRLGIEIPGETPVKPRGEK